MVSFKILKLCTKLGCKVGKTKPSVTLGAVNRPLTSGAKQTAPILRFGTRQAEQTAREMTGATQLAEQNRALISGNRKISFGTITKPSVPVEHIPYTKEGAKVTISYRTSENSVIEGDFVKNIKGYTDTAGNILPHIYLDSIVVYDQGKGIGTSIMQDIIKIAKERCGGRLLLHPSFDPNPSPFYYKCGLRSTTKEGENEILAFLNNGTPFRSASSSPMYLPIE